MGVSAQPGEAVGQGSGLMQSGQTQGSQTAVPQPGGVVQPGIGHTGVVQQKSVTQHQMGGSSQVSGMPGAPHAAVSGAQNVPAVVPGTSVPGVSTTASVTLPNVPVTLVQSQLPSHTSVSRSTGVVQPQHIGHSLMQGTPNVPASLPQSSLGQFQTQAQSLVGQIDDTRRKSEPLPQPPLSLIAENKPPVKPPIPDTLANPLQLPASTPMNSLASSVFGISIPVDGDEDRYELFYNTVKIPFLMGEKSTFHLLSSVFYEFVFAGSHTEIYLSYSFVFLKGTNQKVFRQVVNHTCSSRAVRLLFSQNRANSPKAA